MKKVLIFAAAIVMVASVAFAQYPGGQVSLYSDAAYTDCNLVEALFQQNYVYVVHDMAATGNTAEFMVENNYVGATVLDGGVTYAGLHLGDLYTGVTITYVGCKTLPFLLATATFIPTAANGPCFALNGADYALKVVADPYLTSGQIEIVQCDGINIFFASGGRLSVNGDATCDCFNPVEETTWSRIKALYQ